MKAYLYQSNVILDREQISREEEFQTLERFFPFQYDEIALEKAKYISGGIDMTGVTRVISTKNNETFTVGDKVAFPDDIDYGGKLRTLKIDKISHKLPNDKRIKSMVDLYPNLRNMYVEKVLYLK